MSENKTFEVSLDPESCGSSLAEIFQKTLGIDVHEADDRLHLDIRNPSSVSEHLDRSKVAQNAFDYGITLLITMRDAGLKGEDLRTVYIKPDSANDPEHIKWQGIEPGTLAILVEDAGSPEGVDFLMQAEENNDLFRAARWNNASVANFRGMDPGFYRECLIMTPTVEPQPAPADTAKPIAPMS